MSTQNNEYKDWPIPTTFDPNDEVHKLLYDGLTITPEKGGLKLSADVRVVMDVDIPDEALPAHTTAKEFALTLARCVVECMMLDLQIDGVSAMSAKIEYETKRQKLIPLDTEVPA